MRMCQNERAPTIKMGILLVISHWIFGVSLYVKTQFLKGKKLNSRRVHPFILSKKPSGHGANSIWTTIRRAEVYFWILQQSTKSAEIFPKNSMTDSLDSRKRIYRGKTRSFWEDAPYPLVAGWIVHQWTANVWEDGHVKSHNDWSSMKSWGQKHHDFMFDSGHTQIFQECKSGQIEN